MAWESPRLGELSSRLSQLPRPSGMGKRCRSTEPEAAAEVELRRGWTPEREDLWRVLLKEKEDDP